MRTSTMRIVIYYKGNDPNDCRMEGYYDDVSKIEYDVEGNIQITFIDKGQGKIKFIESVFVDEIEVEINKSWK